MTIEKTLSGLNYKSLSKIIKKHICLEFMTEPRSPSLEGFTSREEKLKLLDGAIAKGF